MLYLKINNTFYFPRIMHASSLQYKPHQRGTYHSHPLYHIIFYDKGCGTTLIDGERTDVVRGTLLFIDPERRHQFCADAHDPHRYLEITFQLTDQKNRFSIHTFKEIFAVMGHVLSSGVIQLDSDGVIQVPIIMQRFCTVDFLNPALDRYQRNDGDMELLPFLHTLAGLCGFSHVHDPLERSADSDAVSRVIAFMNEHYADAITLSMLAREAGLSREHLCRTFRSRKGFTLFQYLLRLRLRIATGLLEVSGLPLKEICVRVGIQDEYYFNRAFRKRYGTTPGRYRASKNS